MYLFLKSPVPIHSKAFAFKLILGCQIIEEVGSANSEKKLSKINTFREKHIFGYAFLVTSHATDRIFIGTK